MTSVNNKYPPGYQAPVVNSYPAGAGNPRDAALIAGQNMNAKQNALNSSVGGRRRNKFRGGASGGIPVPPMQMQYKPTNAGSADPKSQMSSNLSTSMQSRSWAADDAQATNVPSSPPPVGGSRKRKGGYNPDWNWGCYSGGKRKHSRRNKSKKNKRKTKRHHRR
jgi:hypothetical protein